MPSRSASGTTPEDLLAPLPDDVRTLAQSLRELLHALVPGAAEWANPGWKSINYHDAQSGYFCGIFPRPPAVRLLFEHGVALPDPHGLLTGQARQTAWMDLHPGDAIPRDGIAELVRAALLYRAVQ